MYGDFRPVTDAYMSAIRELIKFQTDMMEKMGKDTEVLAAQTRNLVLELALAAIVIAIGFGWWVTRSITRPINEALAAATRIADGDLTVKLESDSKVRRQWRGWILPLAAKLTSIAWPIRWKRPSTGKNSGLIWRRFERQRQPGGDQRHLFANGGHPLIQALFTFALHHFAHRNTGGATNHFGNFLCADLRAQ